jgi:hypothetical protein
VGSSKIRGVMIEKLKRKSILNCDLFKEVTSNNDSKARTLHMTERIAQVLGIKLAHLNQL